MTESLTYQHWRAARWEQGALEMDPTPEAIHIAGQLPAAAQRVILTSPPWELEAEPVGIMQLDLFGLLDTNGASLNDLGTLVLRQWLRWDADYMQRQDDFAVRLNKAYRPVWQPSHPRHKAFQAARQMAKHHRTPVRFTAATGGTVKGIDPTSLALIAEMEDAGLVATNSIRNGRLAQLTKLGWSVAKILEKEDLLLEDVFAEARQSTVMAAIDLKIIQAIELQLDVAEKAMRRAKARPNAMPQARP